ncbi:MAG: hypothetical protein OHK0039_27770 [Bacteroidia bacterium]
MISGLFVAPLAAQHSGNLNYLYQTGQAQRIPDPVPQASILADNKLQFEMSALINLPASAQMAIFNAIQLGETAAEANRLMNLRVQGMIDSLVARGIDRSDIYVDMISQVPLYEYAVEKKLFSKTYNEVPAGFELQKNVHVRYRQGELLNDIVRIAAENEIYDLVKVEYYVADQAAALDTLRQAAARHMHKLMAAMGGLGVRLDTMPHVAAEASQVVFPFERYRTFECHRSTSLEAIKKRSGVTQVRKPQSMYYEKLDYKNYDIVLHPELIEPAVQIGYTLQMRFTVPPVELPKVVEQVRAFYWLTPQGSLQQLKIE